MRTSPALSLVLLGALGCHRVAEVDTDALHFIQVTVLDELPGTADEPAAFTDQPVSYRMKVEALNRNAEPAAYRGTLSVKVQPGDLESADEITLTDGSWEGEVTLRYPFGNARVWFTDDQGDGEGRDPSYVTGVSDALWYEKPTVAQVQATDDHEDNPLEGEYTEIRTDDRTVVIVATGQDGMWVTDLDDPPGEYNSLFIYTYNKPEYSTPEGDMAHEDIVYAEPGQQLASLGGGNQEYLATTQLSFPQYDFVEGSIQELPDPQEIDSDTCGSDDLMEKLEGALVIARNLEIPEFEYGVDSDYYAYGQWPIEFQDGRCTLYAESGTQIPGFYPSEYIGTELDYMQGMLTEVWGKWIILPRNADDIPIYTESARITHGPARPRAQARGAVKVGR